MTRRVPSGLIVLLSLLAATTAEAQVKPRIVIAFDTSGSMALDLDGDPTFGDGVITGCSGAGTNTSPFCGANCTAGVDTDCDGETNDSRIYVAKEAVRNAISAFGDVDWALSRFSQTQSVNESCLNINSYECNLLVTSYGNPQCNTGSVINAGNCSADWASFIPNGCRPGVGGRPSMRLFAAGSPTVCTNYAGQCTGGDVLVGFSDMGPFTGLDNTLGIFSWLNGTESNFVDTTPTGNFCNSSTTGDCELRPEGATPLAGILASAQSYITPIRSGDPRSSCRPYSVILITDGVESCDLTCRFQAPEDCVAPRTAAANLLAAGISTYVVGLSVSGGARTQLNNIATSGGTDAGASGGDTAYFADNPVQLSAGLASIVADSLLVEVCNGADDDCDTFIDEGVLNACGTCGAPPAETCNTVDDDCDGTTDEGVANLCGTCGAAPPEVCNLSDDDCDGIIDEGVCGGCVPSAEICDGMDNDCNGMIDDGVTRPCGTDVGWCTTGIQTCIAPFTFGACTGRGPRAETCNNIDDDCNGVVDGITRACGSSVGVCAPGNQLCTAGSYGTCTGGVGPSAEICDLLDNNCNGSVDEGNPGGGAACGTSTGICTPGMSTCTAGRLVCMGGTMPGTESCNGDDDDCDGTVDEGLPDMGACGMSTVGECRDGILACSMGSYMCVGAVGPSMELCDGFDNDCDGSIDEGNPEAGAPCGDDTGECTAGTTVCAAGTLSCMGGTGPTPEVCDGLDNDCDGVPDEGLGVGAPCGSDVGECSPGVNICSMAALVCTGEIGPTAEICNLLDDDCDGAIDELSLGMPCGTDEGVCMAGLEQCIGGALVCMGAIDPTPESCDCGDNDCDGATDEGGSLCPPGTACRDCSCADPCIMSEFGFTCPTGTTPREEAGECYCVAPRCDDADCATTTVERDGDNLCTPDSLDVANCVCKNNECTFSCDGTICPPGLRCDPRDPLGRCVEDSCRGLGCPDGQVCNRVTAECETDACAAVTCSAGEACRDGVCEGSCADVTCADGEVCTAGVCSTDACADVTCVIGETCDEDTGECITDMCLSTTCPAGTICDPASGDCAEDPCLRLNCPDGEMCVDGECAEIVVVPDGGTGDSGTGPDAGADSGTTDEHRRVLATGGGGCTCSVPGAETAGGKGGDSRTGALSLLVGLLGLGVWRRRRKVMPAALKKAAAVTLALVLTLFIGGCDVEPYCLDCVDADAGEADTGPADTGGGDADDTGVPEDTGPEDTGPVDAGPDGCVPGAPELCNLFDDDCDGLIDEGVDTTADVNNCGACGNRCEPLNAFPECVDSACLLGSCRTGFYNLDGDDTNGCEYRCSTLTPAADDAVCDLRDNDCDGDVDEDVAFDTDPANCGTCGTICRFAHAAGDCSAGVCVLGACDTDFYDIDGADGNGCEYSCTPASPAVETCNAVDDDCDGVVDEGDPGGGAGCGTDVGECDFGTEACVGGAIVCMGSTDPTTELCNGLDDDCDGTADQGNPEGGALCGSGVGACVRGRETCTAGALICTGGVTSTMELCNGLDDNCDGTIDDGNPEGGGSCGSAVGLCMAGTNTCVGGTLTCMGDTGPELDVCNGMDDDCDMSTDEDFDLMNDVRNCGMCGFDCTGRLDDAIEGCSGGTCTILACDDGFVDLDGMDSTGCEYACSIAGSEVCNGADDDCDGMDDNGVTPPPFFCNPNGECAGTTATCLGAGGWTCNYTDPDYEATEVSCDMLDNDCDGATDEPFPNLGDPCGNGAGACRRTGTVVCAAGGGAAICNAPPAGTPMPNELCNDADDDCDGIIDEAIPLSALPTVDIGGGVRIMQYEASRPDATSGDEGTVETRACSAANALPWTNVTWGAARNACTALNNGGETGWRLCDEVDWEVACRGPGGPFCQWSYSSSCTSSSPMRCNGVEYNPSGDSMFPTGSATFADCYTDWSANVVYDMSGNVKEWTNTAPAAGVHSIRGGSYNNIEYGRTCTFDWTVGDNSFSFPNTGFRCCKY